ncbi:Glycerol-3-phosphate dehydrogenase [Aphelenchoides fujianensis]|nr:Glycerol-3-phosphate dehydrogenase [Aphelenchoides fujianensis]
MSRVVRGIRRLPKSVAVGVAIGATAAGFYFFDVANERRFQEQMQSYFRIAHADHNIRAELNKRPSGALPTRADLLNGLRTEEFDVLVIGGGATGAGVALDSTTRGLKTALVELDDFSSGTSSRSTKLIHGGVRYLQAAIMGADIEQATHERYRMVKEALFERANLLEIAPHLSYPLPIMLPVYKLWQVPYYWFGIKAYDFVSGRRILKHSYYIGKEASLERFPMLRKERLKGSLVYYDGAHNDARMNLAIVLTAIRHGARAVNHVKVERLLKDEAGKLTGAHVRDMLTGQEWDVRARSVVNATGPFTDSIRLMADPDVKPICVPSAGVHIVLPGYYAPSGFGLLDPATSDGRVIFFLPWQKMCIAGTTDASSELTFTPSPKNADIEFILKEVRNYLSPDLSIRRGDVMSAWSGLRPLVRDPNKADTKSLARNHIIEVGKSQLITIAGGKWTTYRHMAEETVDRLIKVIGLKPRNGCVTPGLMLEGAHNWDPLLYIHLVQDYGIEVDVAQHLANTYGDRAFVVARMCKMTGKRWPIVGHRLHEEFPYLEAEVQYAIREYACTAIDVVARRLRLAFLNTYAAHQVLDQVVEIMSKELKWSTDEAKRQLDNARQFIDREMGQEARAQSVSEITLNLTREEVNAAKERFNLLDTDRKGHITVNDIRKHFREHGSKIDERLLHELLNEVDLNKNGELELSEFFQLYSGLKGGQITQNRLIRYLDEVHAGTGGQGTGAPSSPSVHRSGGGAPQTVTISTIDGQIVFKDDELTGGKPTGKSPQRLAEKWCASKKDHEKLYGEGGK